jgi:DNA (cytosine-5)-methyltransferase 3A
MRGEARNIDFLCADSPCQGFSFAGKQLAFDDPRSALFFEFVKILNHIKSLNPDLKFMLENVKMKKQYLDVISSQVGVEPVFINSALVSAQNRQRYYWANCHIPQPEDRNIDLSSIIVVNGCGVLRRNGEITVKGSKSNCIDANYFKGLDNRGQRTMIMMAFNRNDGLIKQLDKSYPLNASDWRGLNRNQNQNSVVEIRPASLTGRRINPSTGKREDKNTDLPFIQCLEVGTSTKSKCLTTVAKDTLISLLPPGRYLNEYQFIYRKLLVVEACRLQGVPDDYFKVSSNTQAYKMLGNGWQVDTIEHIFSHLLKDYLADKRQLVA